jgi:hypothetical protein
MIVYGTKATHLSTTQALTETCTNCSATGEMYINVFSRYAHIFWIPLFPAGKIVESTCDNCKQTLAYKKMPEPLKLEATNAKSSVKTPIWHFVGLLLLAGVILWASYQNGQNKLENEAFISAPAIGDVYEYKVEKGSYSTLKVIEVTNDSVFVSENEFVINKSNKLHTIDKLENYSEFMFGMSKVEVKNMFTSGDILDVNRD